jgi:tetratricopeptide (TPR) repeat protein
LVAATDAGVSSPFTYSAFVSYSHRDRRWAYWLHRAIENYRIPEGIDAPRVIRPSMRQFKPAFIDRKELPSSPDLASSVREALQASAFLIVVCSPNACHSRWVNEEIRLFREMGGARRILCLVVGGDPNVAAKDDPSLACFPSGLLEGGIEPLAADVRAGKDDKRTARLRTLSGLLGVPLDTLARRDQVRRHRRQLLISVATSVACVMFAAIALLAWRARNEAERQRVVAVQQARTAQRTTEFMKSLFEVSDPSEARGRSITAREVLDRGALQIRQQLREEPAVRAELGVTLGEVYSGLGLYQQGLQLLTEVQPGAGVSPGLAARQKLAMGELHFRRGELQDALATLVEADQLLSAMPEPQTTARLRTWISLGNVQLALENAVPARKYFQTAVAEIDRAGDIDPSLLSLAREGLALCDQHEMREAEAQAGFESALAAQIQATGEVHPRVAALLNQLGGLAYFRGDRATAADYFRRTLAIDRELYGEQHPDVAVTRNNLARILLEGRRFTQARSLLREAIAARSTEVIDTDESLVFIHANLALAELGLGNRQPAEASFLEALRVAGLIRHRLQGPVIADLADLECRSGRNESGLARLPEAADLVKARYPDDRWRMAQIENIRAACLAGLRRYAEATQLMETSTRDLLKTWPADSLYGHDALQRAITFYRRSGDEARLARYQGLAASR